MFLQSTNKTEDGGVSGGTAFFTGAWSSNTCTHHSTYKGFSLSCYMPGFRFKSTQLNRWNSIQSDWRNEVDNELEKYDAQDWDSYKKNYRETIKNEKEEAKAERLRKEEEAKKLKEQGKDPEGNETFTELQKQVDELKANNIKSLEQKEIDFQQILEKARKKNEEKMEKINKQVELKNEEITKLAEEGRKAKEAGDKTTQNKINALIKKHQEEVVNLNRKKKEVPTAESFKEYLKTNESKGWTFSWKDSRSWLFSFIAISSLTVITLLILWIAKKTKSFFRSD